MKVKEVMSKDPVTIDPAAPLGTAIAVMRSKGIRHLPVVGDAGELVGIITDRDLRHAAFAPALGRTASKSGVAEEAGFAYEDLGEVVEVLHRLDRSRNRPPQAYREHQGSRRSDESAQARTGAGIH